MPAFLAFLAEDIKVGERTARQYLAHLQRYAAWLEQRYRATLLEAATRDLRQYKTELGTRQKPASVNAALAALRRSYGWAIDAERIARNPAQHLTDVAAQPLAPKGLSAGCNSRRAAWRCARVLEWRHQVERDAQVVLPRDLARGLADAEQLAEAGAPIARKERESGHAQRGPNAVRRFRR